MRSLRANVTREQAIAMLRRRGLLSAMTGLFSGPLRAVAEAYLPVHLFQVDIDNRGQHESSVLGLDAISGTLDPYHFERVPSEQDTLTNVTRNRLTPQLSPAAAEDMLVAKVRRVLYGRGFFRLREIKIAARFLPGELHLPYWLGFYGSGTTATLAVVDAVRRTKEGAKARSLFEAWLASGSAHDDAAKSESSPPFSVLS